jgi:hypothetical protein
VIDSKKMRVRFENIMNTFAEIFEKPTTREKNRIYFTVLQEYPIELIERAAQRIIREKAISTFPLPAEIIEKMNDSEDKVMMEALEAWNEAERIAFLGERDSDNPVLNKVITIAFGSWERFGQTDPNNDWDKKHFIDCYKAITKDERLQQLKEPKKVKELEK